MLHKQFTDKQSMTKSSLTDPKTNSNRIRTCRLGSYIFQN